MYSKIGFVISKCKIYLQKALEFECVLWWGWACPTYTQDLVSSSDAPLPKLLQIFFAQIFSFFPRQKVIDLAPISAHSPLKS